MFFDVFFHVFFLCLFNKNQQDKTFTHFQFGILRPLASGLLAVHDLGNLSQTYQTGSAGTSWEWWMVHLDPRDI
jgi:hypothetical protein